MGISKFCGFICLLSQKCINNPSHDFPIFLLAANCRTLIYHTVNFRIIDHGIPSYQDILESLEEKSTWHFYFPSAFRLNCTLMVETLIIKLLTLFFFLLYIQEITYGKVLSKPQWKGISAGWKGDPSAITITAIWLSWHLLCTTISFFLNRRWHFLIPQQHIFPLGISSSSFPFKESI